MLQKKIKKGRIATLCCISSPFPLVSELSQKRLIMVIEAVRKIIDNLIARAFVARSVYNISETKGLRERILSDKSLRQICGWNSIEASAGESTFSRAFTEFSMSELPLAIFQ